MFKNVMQVVAYFKHLDDLLPANVLGILVSIDNAVTLKPVYAKVFDFLRGPSWEASSNFRADSEDDLLDGWGIDD